MSTDDDFSAYVGTHWSGLVRCALLLGCPTHEAEPVVQAALVASYQRWGRSWQDDRVGIDVHTHLMRAINEPLGRSWRGEDPDGEADAVDPYHLLATASPQPELGHDTELQAALATVAPGQRDILVLRHVGELSLGEAAEVLGISVEAARMRAGYALAALQPPWLREDAP